MKKLLMIASLFFAFGTTAIADETGGGLPQDDSSDSSRLMMTAPDETGGGTPESSSAPDETGGGAQSSLLAYFLSLFE